MRNLVASDDYPNYWVNSQPNHFVSAIRVILSSFTPIIRKLPCNPDLFSTESQISQHHRSLGVQKTEIIELGSQLQYFQI
jgi:hypothetical protein